MFASYSTLIRQLEETEIKGNFAADALLWSRCDAVIVDENAPMDIRLRALKIIDRITGEDGLEITEEAVLRHAKYLRDDVGW